MMIRSFGSPYWGKLAAMLVCALLLAACVDDMSVQPYHEPLEASQFFADGRASRPLVPGTVPQGDAEKDEPYYSGRNEAGEVVDAFPFPVTLEVLERGREQYDIYCSPCHGLDGRGDGIVVQRGFSPPQSFHIDRLREAPAGYYYDVITHGFGRMYAYDYRVAQDDRWAIVAYIRALQLSQNAEQRDVPAEERGPLEAQP